MDKTLQNKKNLNLTPDFSFYPRKTIRDVVVHPLGLEVIYEADKRTFHLSQDLREHATDPETTHPITKETLISPLDIPEDFFIKQAEISSDGFIRVVWSHKITPNDEGFSLYYSGWLFRTGMTSEFDFNNDTSIKIWDASNFDNIPVISGTNLSDNKEFEKMLITLIQYGVVIIKGLPVEENTLENVASRIGTIRNSNFGRIFDVKYKHNPDSNAYTNEELLLHNDLSTREYIPGLQLLFCMINETDGGFSTLADGFAIADYIKDHDTEIYDLLSGYKVSFANKAKTSDYRIESPIIRHNDKGVVNEIRWTCWLRSPLRGSLSGMNDFYEAQKKFYKLVNSDQFKVEFKLNPGDMICMDNRRILHGRTRFSETHGERWMRGCYLERDELQSALRLVRRDAIWHKQQ